MWPTFFIPPTRPTPHQANCFDVYTKAADLTRALADGFALDPDLQFRTLPLTTYWVHGLLLFQQVNGAGQPGAQSNFSHSGTTLAFQQLSGDSAGFFPAGATNGTNYDSIPIGSGAMATTGYNSASSSSTAYHMRVFVDALLVVGSAPGVFGVQWGILNGGSGGTTKIVAGSYIKVQRLLP